MQRMILKYRSDTIQFLKTHNEIAIVPADKGNITVAMNKVELEEKVLTLLQDDSTYTICKDPTATLLTKVKDLTKSLVENGALQKKFAEKLYTNAPAPPKLYALPKIHKEGLPIRPIVSWTNSPCYLLSKFIAKILHRSHNGKYNVTNSYEFKRSISMVQLDEEEKLISYDVQSLFTNVPIYLVLCLINQNWNSISKETKLDKKNFLKCMRLCCIDSNYFVYKNTFYKQTFGCPMGSPLAPIMADILMTKLLDLSIPLFSFTPKFMFKYVDDLISVVPENRIEETVAILNRFDERINFTYENEHDGILEYLDLQLIRNNEKMIDTKPYIKPTSKLRILHYQSFHPKVHKRNIVNGTISRLFLLTSEAYKSDAEKIIYDILNKNGYPKNVTTTTISRYKRRRLEPIMENNSMQNITTQLPSPGATTDVEINQLIENVPKTTLYASISYVSKLSEKIAYLLKKHSGDDSLVKIAFKLKNTIKSECFSKLKDMTEKQKISGVVYQISCECGKNYVGQTSNYLLSRMYGHNYDIKQALKNQSTIQRTQNHPENITAVENNLQPQHATILGPTSPAPPNIFQRTKDKSAIFYHVQDTKHNIDVYNQDNVKILCREQHLYKRLIKEMLYINTTLDTINKKSDIDCLSRIYCRILQND